MSEPTKRKLNFNTLVANLVEGMLCHRAIYVGLAITHGSGCILTDKPELYAPIALLYTVLAFRG